MTNAHVVEGAQRIRVVLPTTAAVSPLEIQPLGKAEILEAQLVGLHKETDLALLKVEGYNFPTQPLQTNRAAHPGELVLAIGSPEGLQNSVTMGWSVRFGGSLILTSRWSTSRPMIPSTVVTAAIPWWTRMAISWG